VLPREAQLEILERAAPRFAVTLLAQLDDSRREQLLEGLRSVSREDLRRLMAFRENSAGRLMDRSFLAVQAELTVGQALKRLQQSPQGSTLGIRGQC